MKLDGQLGVAASPATATADDVGHWLGQGFDFVTMKTVRPMRWAPVRMETEEDRAKLWTPIKLKPGVHGSGIDRYVRSGIRSDSVLNRWGVPSPPPKVWGRDLTRALLAYGRGQVIASVQGCPEMAYGDALTEQFVQCAAVAASHGAQMIEVNVSCPNLSGVPLDRNGGWTVRTIAAIKRALPSVDLIAKLSFTEDLDGLAALTTALSEHVSGISAINAIPAACEEFGRGGASGQAVHSDATLAVDVIRDAAPEDVQVIGMGGVNSRDGMARMKSTGANAVAIGAAAFLKRELTSGKFRDREPARLRRARATVIARRDA